MRQSAGRRQLEESRRARVAPPHGSAMRRRWVGVTMAALLVVASMSGGVLPARAAAKCVPGPGAESLALQLHEQEPRGQEPARHELHERDPHGCEPHGANLTGAIMTKSTITRTKFAGATLTSVQSGGVNGTPASLPTFWRLVRGYLVGPHANLARANLRNASLSTASLQFANLRGADLGNANLHNANLATRTFATRRSQAPRSRAPWSATSRPAASSVCGRRRRTTTGS